MELNNARMRELADAIGFDGSANLLQDTVEQSANHQANSLAIAPAGLEMVHELDRLIRAGFSRN